jgi:hypothetical protein
MCSILRLIAQICVSLFLPMENPESPNHDNNVYAFNKAREPKHISEVDSGKKGYICMGCGWEMIAKKGLIRYKHFAHAPRTYEDKKTCVFKDETYRHKLAKENLQSLKRIKVPATYIFSDDKSNAQKIQEARYVHAATVRNELQFYEDENGEVQFGRGISFLEDVDKDLLIQPDVTFFNSEGEPILLIELVATHKVTPEKLVKIQRLGIDTVEIIIPKSSPGDIEKAFSSVVNTRWIYNHEKTAKQNSISVPSSTGSGIPPDAEYQKSILTTEETYRCRKTHLKDLIRGIRKCLATEQFRSAQQRVNLKLSRVQKQTEDLDSQIRQRREECIRKFEGENEEQLRELGERRKRVRAATKKNRDILADLERRYSEKDQELRDEESGLRSIQAEYRSEHSGRVEELREELRGLGGNTQSGRELEADFDRRRRRRDDSIRRTRVELKRIEEEKMAYSEGTGEYRERVESEMAAKIRKREEETTGEIRDLEREFKDKRQAIIEGIQNGTFEGIPRLRRGHYRLANYRQLLTDIRESSEELKYYGELKRIFESGTWKE